MTFGEKLFKLRRQEGFSQEDLAGRLNASRQAVSRWEQGETMPDAPNLLQISRLFGVSADYLLHDECESDRDIPAVRTTERDLNREHVVLATVLILCVLQAMTQLLGLYGLYVSRNALLVTLALIMSIAGVAGFEAGFQLSKLCRPLWEKARESRRLYYRIAVWLVSFVPIRSLTAALLRLYPRPFNAAILELCAVLIYLAFCLTVTILLRRKRGD